MSARKPHP